MIRDKGRPLCRGHNEIGCLQRRAVDHAEIALDGGRGPVARAEAILSADIKRELRLQASLVLPQEPDETAEMIVVAVAQHEGVDLGRCPPAI